MLIKDSSHNQGRAKRSMDNLKKWWNGFKVKANMKHEKHQKVDVDIVSGDDGPSNKTTTPTGSTGTGV